MAMPQFNLGQRWANIRKTVGDIAQMKKSAAERKRAERFQGQQMLQNTLKDVTGYFTGLEKEKTRQRERQENIDREQEQFEWEKFIDARDFADKQWQRKVEQGEANLDRYIAQRDRAEEIELRTKQFEIKSDQWDKEFSNKVNQQNLAALRLHRQNEQDRINRAIDQQDKIARQAQLDRQWKASQEAINESNRLERLSIDMELAEKTQELRANVIEGISDMFPATVLTQENIEDSIASASALISSNTFNEDDENENKRITDSLIAATELMLRGRLEAIQNEDAMKNAALGDPKFIASATEAYEGIRLMAEGNMNIQTDTQGNVIWGEKEQNELNKRVTDIINTLRESGIYPEITITSLEAFHGNSLNKKPSTLVQTSIIETPIPLNPGAGGNPNVSSSQSEGDDANLAPAPIPEDYEGWSYDPKNPIRPLPEMFDNQQDYQNAKKTYNLLGNIVQRAAKNFTQVPSWQSYGYGRK